VPDLHSISWRAQVRGAIYAQPLVSGSRVFIVTEEDEVYALDLATGRTLWKAGIGTPLTNVAQTAGCGNVDPLGITSTPVLDAATGTLYVVGEVSTPHQNGGVERRLVGFDVSSGKVVRTADADPTGGGDNQVDLMQRPGLVLEDGRVYVAFGGLYGDCGYYHGWLVGVSTRPGVSNIEFDATAGGSGGAIWQGGAPPTVDAAGDIFVGTGNQNSQGTAGYYESVVKLSPTLSVEASFRDRLATDDADFGTGAPALLSDGTVFAVGKTNVGYVLRQSNLQQVSRIPGVCGSDPDGRVAVDQATDTLFVPCSGGGVEQIHAASGTRGWRSGDVNSSPVLGDGALWALGYPNGSLQALNPTTGAVEQSTTVGPVAHFATPALAGGTLVVGTESGQVIAFS
jgi:outer membrane protein assembly factor BamB